MLFRLSDKNKPWLLTWLTLTMTLTTCVSGLSQQVDLADGPAGMATFIQPLKMGPPQSFSDIQAISTGLPYYSANYTSLAGTQLSFRLVGTDPSLGAATTIVPAVIVPIKLIFPNSGNPTLDGSNVLSATQNSPIFLTADYTTGGTDVGFTQYGDAIQHGEFWNYPGFSQAGYHVLLGSPTVAPTVTINVPSGSGNVYLLRSGGLIGVVDDTFFDNQLGALIAGYTAGQLPIFLTDNVFEGVGGVIGNCCVLGYHNSQSGSASTAKTWIFSAYTEPGTFTGNVILDVQALSHEVAEWLNDPFVNIFSNGINFIPPSILPGTGGACIFNFEVGDPLESPPVSFTQVTNGTTYHLQGEVFLPWYLHSIPSFSVNGWYTFLNTFTTFSTLCSAG
jgi:hypothetical protein